MRIYEVLLGFLKETEGGHRCSSWQQHILSGHLLVPPSTKPLCVLRHRHSQTPEAAGKSQDPWVNCAMKLMLKLSNDHFEPNIQSSHFQEKQWVTSPKTTSIRSDGLPVFAWVPWDQQLCPISRHPARLVLGMTGGKGLKNRLLVILVDGLAQKVGVLGCSGGAQLVFMTFSLGFFSLPLFDPQPYYEGLMQRFDLIKLSSNYILFCMAILFIWRS